MVYLFDIDGVIIHYEKYFSTTLDASKYFDPINTMNAFFHNQINCECDKGKKDIFCELVPYLNKMKWVGNPEEYCKLQWNFEKDFIGREILNNINRLKRLGNKVFIASNQNKHRKQFLINEMKLHGIFDECFFSCDIGYVKNEKEYWNYVESYFICNEINKEDAIFYDDLIENCNKAKEFGIHSVQIKNKKHIEAILEQELRKMA